MVQITENISGRRDRQIDGSNHIEYIRRWINPQGIYTGIQNRPKENIPCGQYTRDVPVS